jgi:oligo-1,6-glucosidase
MLAFFTMTLSGMIFLHQGQEIGSRNLTDDIPLVEYKDMATHGELQKIKDSRATVAKIGVDEVDISDVMKDVRLKARDHTRVPLAWDGGAGAGFTTGTPWMTLGSTYKEINVAAQEKDADSVLNTWKEMIAFRKQHVEELVYGTFELVDEEHEQVFAYTRTAENGSKLLVALNWGHLFVKWKVPSIGQVRKLLKKVGAIQEVESSMVIEMGGYSCACWQI